MNVDVELMNESVMFIKLRQNKEKRRKEAEERSSVYRNFRVVAKTRLYIASDWLTLTRPLSANKSPVFLPEHQPIRCRLGGGASATSGYTEPQ